MPDCRKILNSWNQLNGWLRQVELLQRAQAR